MRTRQTVTVLAVLAALHLLAVAEDAKLIRIGKGDWAPYVCERHLNKGKPGYAADILATAFKDAGYTVEFTSVNYARGIAKTRKGEFTIMACMYREDAPDLVFPRVRLGASVNRFFVRKDNAWRLDGLDSLAKVRVGLVKGYKYPEFQEYIDAHADGFVFISGETPLQRILKMVQSGRLDAAFDDAQVVRHEAIHLGLEEDFVDAGGFGVENDVLVGFSPADKRTPELVRVLEKGIRNLRREGRLTVILERYGLKDWETRPELVVAMAHWPPWKIVNQDGTIDGVDARILRAMEGRLGVSFRFEAYPWRRCVEMLKSGRADLVTSFSRTPEREAFTKYIMPPYVDEKIVCYARKGEGAGVTEYAHLYGKRLGTVRGSAYTGRFDNDSRLSKTVVELEEQLFRMLDAGRIDLAVAFEGAARFRLAELDMESKVDLCPLRLQRDDAAHFALSRKSAHVDLAPRLAEAVREMLESGEIARIIDGPGSREEGVREHSGGPAQQ